MCLETDFRYKSRKLNYSTMKCFQTPHCIRLGPFYPAPCQSDCLDLPTVLAFANEQIQLMQVIGLFGETETSCANDIKK